MKKHVILAALAVVFLSGISPAEETKKAAFAFSAVTDFAWYQKSDYISGSTHYAPFTGWYDGIQAQTTLNASYKIPVTVPLLPKSNPLFEGNNVTLAGALQISPVSIMPELSVSFTPAAFLSFSAGTRAGTGWEFPGSQGMAEYNAAEKKYDNLTPLKSWYVCGWVSGTFMFDTAALWPGDWHHIVMVANYEVNYKKLTGTESPVWDWQTTKNCADGWQYDQYYLLGYQMPSIVSLAGVSAELYGHYNAADYGEFADRFGGDFMTIEVCPLMQLTFSPHDSLFVIFNFKARRSFAETHAAENEEPLLTYTGREWYFQRIALRWTHTF
jgi:hypothetical protein